MSTSPLGPTFAEPPVIETAMAIEFSPIPGFTVSEVVHLADTWKDRYPTREDQPPLPPSNMEPAAPALQFNPFASVRLWCIDEERGFLLQLQQDRLILNWRAGDSNRLYPGYEALEREYRLRWEQTLSFLASAGLSIPTPRIVEFTYVNVIERVVGAEVDQALNVLSSGVPGLPGHEGRLSYTSERLVDGENQDPGTVTTTVSHDVSNPKWHLTVVTRLPAVDAGSDPLDRLGRAHEYGKATFIAITTPLAHRLWGADQ